MSLNPLNPHYAMENPASVYDEEAMTALELAGRTTAKVNEAVQAFNNLLTETTNRLDNQDKSIPVQVAQQVSDHIERGTFNAQIEEHIGNLEDRVDSLLGSVTEGSTTLDAEVIDMRTDSHGTTYVNAGEAVRAQIREAMDGVAFVSEQMCANIPIHVKTKPGYVVYSSLTSGTVDMREPTDAKEFTTDFIPILTDRYFKVELSVDAGEEGTGWMRILLLDENLIPNNIIDVDGGTSGKNVLTFVDRGYENCAFIVISYRSYNNAKLKMVYHNPKSLTGKFPYYREASEVELCQVPYWVKGFPMTNGDMMCSVTNPTGEYTSDFIPVEYGRTYRYFYDVENPIVTLPEKELYYAWCCVSTYDKDKNFIARIDTFTRAHNESGQYSYQKDYRFNEDVAFVRISCRSYFNATAFIGVVKSAPGQSYYPNCECNVKAVAHRGYSAVAPENTIPAYKKAKEAGFYYVECDVQCTSDGVLVLFHDPDMTSKTGGALTGSVHDHTYAEIKDLDIGSNFSPEFAGVKIPTFEEFISYCRCAGLHPYIELKTKMTQAHADMVLEMVRKYGMESQVTWIGMQVEYISTQTTVGRYAYTGYTPTDANIAKAAEARRNGLDFFLDVNDTSDEWVNKAKAAGVPYEVWIINDPETILNLNPYITGVTSDCLHAGKVLAESVR